MSLSEQDTIDLAEREALVATPLLAGVKRAEETEALQMMDWIPLKRYLDLTGESREAIRKRIKIKAWKRGEQYSVPHGADVWVSLSGVRAWAARDIRELKEHVGLTSLTAALGAAEV